MGWALSRRESSLPSQGADDKIATANDLNCKEDPPLPCMAAEEASAHREQAEKIQAAQVIDVLQVVWVIEVAIGWMNFKRRFLAIAGKPKESKFNNSQVS